MYLHLCLYPSARKVPSRYLRQQSGPTKSGPSDAMWSLLQEPRKYRGQIAPEALLRERAPCRSSFLCYELKSRHFQPRIIRAGVLLALVDSRSCNELPAMESDRRPGNTTMHHECRSLPTQTMEKTAKSPMCLCTQGNLVRGSSPYESAFRTCLSSVHELAVPGAANEEFCATCCFSKTASSVLLST